MINKQKKEPVIRFDGFTDAWEQRKLLDNTEDVLDYRGKSPNKFGMTWGETGYLVLSALNVKDGYIDKNIEAKYGDEDLFHLWMGSRRLEKGDVIFTTEAPLGNVAQVPDNKGYILNQRAVAFKIKKNRSDNNFFAQLLKSPLVQSKLIANASGGTAKGLGMKEFAKLSSFVPKNVDESIFIGNFFKQLDETITLQERELELLKEQKKGFLQKMFPKKDSKVPEIRFTEFTDDWEQRKLEEIFNILDGDRGKNYPSENDFLNDGSTLFLDTGNVTKNGFYFTKCKYISKEKNNSLKNGELELNDFVLTSRGTLGNIAYYNELIALNFPSIRINSAMLILRPLISNKISNDYMLSVLRGNIIELFMKKNHVGSAQPHITKKDFSKLIVNIPKELEEQTEIGYFFKQLDETITLQEHKLETLKNMKKSFLQKMFV